MGDVGARRPGIDLRANRPLATAVVTGTVLTLVVAVLPLARFSYDNAALHLALETAEGVIAALLAYLAVERYRATGRLQHVVLAWVFSVLAFVNLAMSAGPLVAQGGRPGGWLTWATLGLRLCGSAALCAGAYAGRRPAPGGRTLGWGLAAVTLATLVAVGLAASAAHAWLGAPVKPLTSDGAFTRPWTLGHPLVLGIQLVGFGLYAGAAAGFTLQAREQHDELLRWLGAGAVLGALARVNYVLFPSLYSNYVYAGDLLRLGSYLFFLIGAAREIDAYWRDQTRLAAVEERRRLARDLHDGLAQELAFIRSQAAAMAEGKAVPGMEKHLSAAAERALTEARRAVEALSDAGAGAGRAGGAGADGGGEPLAQALVREAEEVAGRAGATVGIEVEGSPAASPAAHEALVRVTREAANNALRHGGATNISIFLSAAGGRVRLSVSDDGGGFDPQKVKGGHGLRSMRERVEGLGGTFSVSSGAGQGAVVEVEVAGAASGRS